MWEFPIEHRLILILKPMHALVSDQNGKLFLGGYLLTIFPSISLQTR